MYLSRPANHEGTAATVSRGLQDRIAVLIPVYNNWPGLQASLRSLRQQSILCQVIVVDDGSTPPVCELACRAEYPRVQVIRNPENRGIVAALNRGIEAALAGGPDYLARLDAGDRCAPLRLELQGRFLDNYPSVMLVGSDVNIVDVAGNVLHAFRFPRDWKAIRRTMHVRSTFSHPAVMFRSSVFGSVGVYSPEDVCAEDYGLFFRIANAFPVANIPMVLTDFEMNPNGISLTRRARQLRTRLRIQLQHFDYKVPESYLGVLKSLALIIAPDSMSIRAKESFFRLRARFERVPAEGAETRSCT